MIWQHQARNDERLLTPRLELVPVVADDAEELTDVFGDQRLYAFLASHPTTTEELRAQFARLAAALWSTRRGPRSATGRCAVAATAERWACCRRPSPIRAAPLRLPGRSVCPGRGRALPAVVGWLERRRVSIITAHIHPDHHASATVATRAGLRPTGEYRDHEGIREQLWRRELASWGN